MHRLVTHQRSVGLDSVTSSGAPPPGYTSQRDTASSVVMNNDEEDEEEKTFHISPPLPAASIMDSPYMRDPLYTLPSPYSTEDLRLQPAVESPDQVQQNPRLSLRRSSTRGCPHGYTHTHSQCTPASPSFQARSLSSPNVQRIYFPTTPETPPVRSSSYYPPQHHQQRDADDLFAQSSPSSERYHRCSTEEHWQSPAGSPQQQQTTPPYANHSLPSSPYRHHHRHQNTNSPPLRVLTYSSADDCTYEYDCHECEACGNEEDPNEDHSPLNTTNVMMMMNSTATILSPQEESSGYQSHDSPHRHRHHHHNNNHRHSSLQNETLGPAVVESNTTSTPTQKINSKTSTKDHSTPPPPQPSTQTQPTNYVHLSRKCKPSIPISKSRGWRRKTVHTTSTQIPPPRLSSSSSSAITGTFTINPELYIPPSLLNAMEDPVFRFKSSSDAGETTRTRNKRRGNARRTNLKLEIENGGIDVDVHLVPTPSISSTGAGEPACIGNTRGQPVQAQASASTSSTAFSGPSPTETFETRPQPSCTNPRLSTTSIRIQENTLPSTRKEPGLLKSAVRHTSSGSRREKKKPSQPTTIDLRIKQAPQGVQDQDLVKTNEPISFPLIARIHAPNPRPPFHLFASTIDAALPKEPQVPNTHDRETHSRVSTSNPSVSEPTLATNSLPLQPSSPPQRRRTRRSLSKSRPQRRVVSSSYGGTPTTPSLAPSSPLPTPITTSIVSQLNSVPPPPPSSSSSPLYLHLPRTFRGPLTIHISSGHISDHLRLSEGLEREMALIRESEFGRGYFVGGLGWDAEDADLDTKGRRNTQGQRDENANPDANLIHPDEKRVKGGNTHPPVNNTEKPRKKPQHPPAITHQDSESSLASSISSSTSPPPPPGKKLEEWYGDRIEIRVGSGDVYLQFEDEDEVDDPFCVHRARRDVGFWKRFAKGFFFL